MAVVTPPVYNYNQRYEKVGMIVSKLITPGVRGMRN